MLGNVLIVLATCEPPLAIGFNSYLLNREKPKSFLLALASKASLIEGDFYMVESSLNLGMLRRKSVQVDAAWRVCVLKERTNIMIGDQSH